MPTEQKNEETATVVLSLRLGWALSEFIGRARLAWQNPSKQNVDKTLTGFAKGEVPRFTYSDRYFSKEGAWWQAALNIVSLAKKLNLFDDNDEAAKIQQLPVHIYTLTFERSGNITTPQSPREFYDLLEPWSRQVGITLATRSDLAALAFKVGGQLADTYWFMRSKECFGQPRDTNKDDSWHQLLNHQRLVPIIEDIKRFENYLPTSVGECLRFTLYHWMIAHDLDYQQGKLVLVRKEHQKNPNLEREKYGIIKQIDREDEGHIKNQLFKQTNIWRALIFGLRSPEDYLKSKSKRRAIAQAVGLYALIVIGLALLLAGGAYFLIPFLGNITLSVYNLLFPAQTQPDTLKTTVEIVTKALPFITGGLVFVITLLRDSWSGMRGLWPRIYDNRREQKIKEGTLINWQPQRKKRLRRH